MKRLFVLLLASVSVSACGTYSMLRPADTIPRGAFEVNAGLAANGLGEVLPVVQGAIGLADRLELVGQYEIYNGFGELRGQVLDSRQHGVGLTLGVGGGVGFTFAEALGEDEETVNDGAATASLVIGRELGSVDLYLGDRIMWLIPSYAVNTTKLGVRINAGRYFRVIAEGGATIHNGGAVLAEGTVAIGLGF
jgi:hypothetical protein